MSKASPPLTRVRGKSTPRAKSPDPRSLKKAAKALVTPPPKGSNKSERKSSSSSGKKAQDAQRKLSFGKNSETHREIANPVLQLLLKLTKSSESCRSQKRVWGVMVDTGVSTSSRIQKGLGDYNICCIQT